MFGHTTGVTVSLLVALCSLAVHTYGQNEPEVNTNLLRQILQEDVDLLSELDQLTNDKEDTESGDWLPDGPPEDNESAVQKRFTGYGLKLAQRKRFLGRFTRPGKRQFRRNPLNKRLFCNFGGCFNGKRSVPSEPNFLFVR
ncbi:uncharacterized protein LOC128181333 [Crassostrea angulata]|uniref:uncharacterized protein LOC128181333 n=1 Tax=Magallana angulata TaxID=2784310 RepID=UPI0022B217B0|nr:uncharacterized protein LOC128181333 [Crassostrea angulata]